MDAYAQPKGLGKVDTGMLKEALNGMSPGREVRLDYDDGRPMEVIVGTPSLQKTVKSGDRTKV